jgi:hypothetical protein
MKPFRETLIYFFVNMTIENYKRVILAKAGIQNDRKPYNHWIPAFAGMTRGNFEAFVY